MEGRQSDLNTSAMEVWFAAEYPERSPNATPDEPAGLFIFMHRGDTDSPPDQPFKMYVDPDNGVLQPYISDIPFIRH